MVAKDKCRVELRRRIPESRSSATQEWVLRTVHVRRGVEGEEVIKFLTVRNLITPSGSTVLSNQAPKNASQGNRNCTRNYAPPPSLFRFTPRAGCGLD